MMNRSAVLAALCACFLSGPAFAAGDCYGFGIDDDAGEAQLGEVTNDGRLNFVANAEDVADCPSPAPSCQRRGFLVAGDRLVVSRVEAPYACASFIDRKGRLTTGWLPDSGIEIVAPAGGWAGEWERDGSASVTLTDIGGGRIEANGNATSGSGAATHIGQFTGTFKAKLAYAKFAMGEGGQVPFDKAGEFDCAVSLALLSPYLVVQDNGNCGGANVRFTGVYTRR